MTQKNTNTELKLNEKISFMNGHQLNENYEVIRIRFNELWKEFQYLVTKGDSRTNIWITNRQVVR